MKKLLFMIIIYSCLLKVIVAAPVKIIAAENFYGELALEIGGSNVQVQSIINNPNANPHLFAVSPQIIKQLDQAQIIIYNGAGYDSWMKQLLQSINTKHMIVINVAQQMRIKNGANPHIWYQPNTFAIIAKSLSTDIINLNPHAQYEVKANLAKFLAANKQIINKIKQMKAQYAGIAVTATEPIFNYMLEAMGFTIKGLDLQWKIMNGSEPTPKMLAAYQALISQHQVKVLFYNSQVISPITQNILSQARQNKIVSVGISETIPSHRQINAWLNQEINLTNHALQVSK